MLESVVLAILVLVIVYVVNLIIIRRNPIVDGVFPPGSMGLPLIGETLQFFSPQRNMDIVPFISERTRRYGPIFKTHFLGQPTVVSTDVQLNNYIFQEEESKFQFLYPKSFMDIFGSESISSKHSSVHKYLRNLVLKSFGVENIKNRLIHEIEDAAWDNLSSWETKPSVDVKEATSKMILHLASKMTFSSDANKLPEDLHQNFAHFLDGLLSIPILIRGTAYYKCVKGRQNVMKVIKSMLKQRNEERNNQHDDFLQVLIEEMNKGNLTEEPALDLLFILLFASHETTSTALTLAIKLLADNPRVLEEMTVEHQTICRTKKSKDSQITWAELKSMSFTFKVINETVRLANIVPCMFRKAMEDIQFKGYMIPTGWMVMVCPPAIHLNPDIYDHPLSFNPRRWKVEHETICRTKKSKDSQITWAELKSMSFTFKVINETVRLANIVPCMFRKAMEDIQFKGYMIPTGWMVMVCPPAIHLNPDIYDHPLSFNPRRWKDTSASTNGSKNFMAFGGGMRLCAGADFAKMQIAVFLHCLVTKYKWRTVKGGDIVRTPGVTFPEGYHIQLLQKD